MDAQPKRKPGRPRRYATNAIPVTMTIPESLIALLDADPVCSRSLAATRIIADYYGVDQNAAPNN